MTEPHEPCNRQTIATPSGVMTPLGFFFYQLTRTMSFDYSYRDSLMWAVDQTQKAFPGADGYLAAVSGLDLMDKWQEQTGSPGTFGYKVD